MMSWKRGGNTGVSKPPPEGKMNGKFALKSSTRGN
jgi:hypothetical protein